MAVSRVNTVHVLCVSAPDGQQPTAPPREFPRHRKVPRRTSTRRTLTASRTPYCTPQPPIPVLMYHSRPRVKVKALCAVVSSTLSRS
jgi:hypothetical protein